MESEYERNLSNWRAWYAERPHDRSVHTLEGSLSETESCINDERGVLIFSLHEFRALRFWFFRDADPTSFQACLDSGDLKREHHIRLLVWNRVDRCSPVCFVRAIDLIGRAPQRVDITLSYTDGSRRHINVIGPKLLREQLQFVIDHSHKQTLREELTRELAKLCPLCGAVATILCPLCVVPMCRQCEHVHTVVSEQK